MSMTTDQLVALVRELFRRVSSDGKIAISPCLTDDVIYDSPYNDGYLQGAQNIDLMFRDILPRFLMPLRQWPIAIYPTASQDLIPFEYEGHCTVVRDGSIYANRYFGLIKLRDDKVCFWREYYNVDWYSSAVGPEYRDIVAQMLPRDAIGMKSKFDRDTANYQMWQSQYVLPEFYTGSPW